VDVEISEKDAMAAVREFTALKSKGNNKGNTSIVSIAADLCLTAY
jgi:hypothetical protein